MPHQQESDNHSAHFNGHIDSVGADINVPIQQLNPNMFTGQESNQLS